MKVMISCKEATKFISQQEEKKLSRNQRLQLWMHLAICTFCKLFYKQNLFIIRNAPHLDSNNEASLSSSEKQALVAELENTH
jgi:hypothetical protein